MQVLSRERLLNDGFLSLNLKDIDESLYNQLYKLSNKKILESFIHRIRYEFSVTHTTDIEYIKKICEKYVDEVKNDDNNIRINSTFKNNFNDFILLYDELKIFSKNEFQYWFYTSIVNDQFYNVNSQYQNDLNTLVNTIHKNILMNCYNIPDNEFKYSHTVDLTLYTKNGFIVPHEDGYDEGRLCVILMYLNEDYIDGFGGELKVNDVVIKPNFGEIIILDFTKNNPKHEVLRVIDDNFKRFAFIKFFYQ